MADTGLILDFLKTIACNNNVDWMHANKDFYTDAKAEFELLCEEILLRLSEFEPGMSGLTAKQCTFRLARDTRFSTDKSPYKINFAAYFVAGGKKRVGAGYYLHLQPGDESMVCCSLHCPPPEALKVVRDAIYADGQQLAGIVESDGFKRRFTNFEGRELKRLPRGYAPSPYDRFMKMKDFDAWSAVGDDEVRASSFTDYVVESFRIGKPFNDFFNAALEDTDFRSVF